ncbi:MAG: T9SS type A sorting domain-containing protein [Chitinophagaceae bacterium]|nr:T9SS type A sorting domain-containing protein [Chitinophagaceae bacterium]
MKQIITLVFVLLLALQTQAQRWFPVGATFTFTMKSGSTLGYLPDQPVLWTVTDSIVKKGKMCRTFSCVPEIKESRAVYAINVYDSNSVVYWYRPHLDSFTVLYDFNKNVGEIWEIFGVKSYKYSTDTIGCTLTASVLAKDTVFINGFPLRRMNIKIDYLSGAMFGGGFSGTVVEYIGHLERPRPDPYYACEAVSESDDFWGLRCFDHPDIGFHDFKIVPYCDYVPSSIDEFNALQDLNISPNPATDFFDIKYQNTNKAAATLIVSNLMGQQVLAQKLNEGNQKINVSNWSAGVYFYQILQEGQVIAKGKLMKG